MADNAREFEDGVADDFLKLYRQAMSGDEDARTSLWKEFRGHMHRVIRLKAADLSREWAVEPDEIYDSFMAALLTRRTPIQFHDRIHFACYIEKSVRRQTKRILHAARRFHEVGLEVCGEVSVDVSALEELIREEELASASAALTDREQAICSLVTQGCTWRVAGQRLGLSEDAARMLRRRAVGRIRTRILSEA
jgi:DNA-binding NarL/FixJ family response regulator